jgi:hypothetical protein
MPSQQHQVRLVGTDHRIQGNLVIQRGQRTLVRHGQRQQCDPDIHVRQQARAARRSTQMPS